MIFDIKQVAIPELYPSAEEVINRIKSREKIDTILNEYDKELDKNFSFSKLPEHLNENQCVFMMLSGGFGSMAALSVLIKKGIIPSIIYFEDIYENSILNKNRQISIQRIMTDMRTNDGMPLISFHEGKWKSWLSSFNFSEINSMSKKDKLSLLIVKLWDMISVERNKEIFVVWGSVINNIDVFQKMSSWPMKHCIIHNSYEEMLYEIFLNQKNALIIEETLWTNNREEQQAGFYLPSNIVNFF